LSFDYSPIVRKYDVILIITKHCIHIDAGCASGKTVIFCQVPPSCQYAHLLLILFGMTDTFIYQIVKKKEKNAILSDSEQIVSLIF
jgi:hypothetical protein